MLTAALMFASAWAYRIRGSDFMQGIHGGRAVKLAIGSAPVALAAFLAGVPWWAALLVWLGVALADTTGHGEGLHVNSARSFAIMVGTGFLSAMPVFLVLAAWNQELAIIALALGGLKGPAYWIGWRTPFRLPLILPRSTEWGEFWTGATRALFPLLL